MSTANSSYGQWGFNVTKVLKILGLLAKHSLTIVMIICDPDIP